MKVNNPYCLSAIVRLLKSARKQEQAAKIRATSVTLILIRIFRIRIQSNGEALQFRRLPGGDPKSDHPGRSGTDPGKHIKNERRRGFLGGVFLLSFSDHKGDDGSDGNGANHNQTHGEAGDEDGGGAVCAADDADGTLTHGVLLMRWDRN